jgi:hypothetical protein
MTLRASTKEHTRMTQEEIERAEWEREIRRANRPKRKVHTQE